MRNWMTAAIALGLAVVVFVGNLFVTRAMKPKTVEVVAAARALPVGTRITENDLTTLRVYEDERAGLYLPADRLSDLVGGYVLREFAAGEPIVGDAVLATGGARTTSILADRPDATLFPIPLDASNVIAGTPSSYRPGDIVGITVVFTAQPEEPPAGEETAPAAPAFPAFPETAVALPTPTATSTPASPLPPFEDRGYPPVARSLTLDARVVQVTGLPMEPQAADEAGNGEAAAIFASTTREDPYLWVMLPAKAVEPLSLALSEGEVYVYLSHPEAQDRPGGFSYWDFLARLRSEREGMSTPAPVGTPSAPSPSSSRPSPTPSAPLRPTPTP